MGQVQLQQGDVTPVIQQHSPHGAVLPVDAHVLIVQPQVEVLDVEPADLGGVPQLSGARIRQGEPTAGLVPARLSRLWYHPVTQVRPPGRVMLDTSRPSPGSVAA